MRRLIPVGIALTLAASLHALPAVGQNEGMGVLGPQSISKIDIIRGLIQHGRTRGIGRARKPARDSNQGPTLALKVEFEYNSDKLSASSTRQLDVLAEALKDESLKPFRFLIAGHTDGRGADAHNQQLSERRAGAVKAYLVTTRGIEDARLLIAGFGKSKPLYPADPLNPANRRVEIINLGS